MELVTGKFQWISSSHYSNRKVARHCSMVRFKEKCPPHRIDCPWEENREEAHKRKKNRYETLCADSMDKDWICHVISIEFGCQAFLGHSVISFLSKIGITGRSLKVISNRLQTTAQYESSWIWLKAKSLQHE